MQAKKIPSNLIDINLSNPNEMTLPQLTKLRENIVRTKQYPSLIVLKKEERYLLLDGHNRLQILRDLSEKEVWCEVWELGEKDADLLLATLNRLHGIDDVTKRADLLKKLFDEFGDTAGALYDLLPESMQAINSLLDISEDGLMEDINQDILEDRLSQVVDEDVAKKLAKAYKPTNNDEMRVIFTFEKESDYYKACQFFGIYPDTKKLMNLIKKYGT